MNVLAVENGQRPTIDTKARKIAPQAAKYLASKLEDHVFADSAIIVIDWKGDFGWDKEANGEMPPELLTPIMFVATEKWYPQWNARLTVDYKLDLEDFFGADNATSNDLDEVIENLETKVHEMEKQRSGN